MSILNWNNKSLSYIFILVALFGLVFFARPEYVSLNENLDTQANLALEKTKIEAENFKLSKLEKDLKNPDSEKWKEISKYLSDYKEDEIIRYFYDYAEKNNTQLSITSLSMWETKVNELWFKESTINLSINFSWEDAMISFLIEILKPESKYKFFLSSLSYPIENAETSFSLALPIKVFHK